MYMYVFPSSCIFSNVLQGFCFTILWTALLMFVWFPSAVSSLWNDLPERVKLSPSLASFKTALKTCTCIYEGCIIKNYLPCSWSVFLSILDTLCRCAMSVLDRHPVYYKYSLLYFTPKIINYSIHVFIVCVHAAFQKHCMGNISLSCSLYRWIKTTEKNLC